MKKNSLIYLFLVIVFFSCENEKKIETTKFLNHINIDNWNNSTYYFIKRNCPNIENNYRKFKDSIIIDSQNGERLNTFKDHLNSYLKVRENFLLKLKEEYLKLGKRMDTLVVSETYFGVSNPKISYLVINDEMTNGIYFYYQSETFQKTEEVDVSHKKYDYNLIKEKKAECINQQNGIMNSVNFETVFYFDSEGKMKYNLKTSYFGNSIID